MPSSKRPRGSKRKKRHSKRRIILLGITSIISLMIAGLAIFIVIAAAGTPKWDPAVLNDTKQSSYVYDKDGNEFAVLHGYENRQTVEFSQIPDIVKKTFIAVEDKRFEQHFGVDPIRIIGSALNDIRTRSAREGASTITIQLARNAFIANPTEKKLTRKVQEAILAIQLEREYTKDEILTFYLNRIFLGESSFGIQAAAKTYFGKELKDLTPAEVALLAGLPQAPSQYNPFVHPDDAKARRTVVLGVMRDSGIITSQEYDEAKDEPFTYVESMKANNGGSEKTEVSNASYKFPYFVDYVIEELETTYNLTPDQIFSGGLHIYTTVNPKIQSAAEDAFANDKNFPQGINGKEVEGAMTVIDPTTGEIQAMVGGRDYTPRGLNRAWQSKRQPGSTIKPLVVYGPAIEKGGYFPGTVLDDMPVSYNDGSGSAWQPTDYDTITQGWKGLITMRYAVEESVNIYAVKLLDLIGVDYGWAFGKNNLGLPLEPQDQVLSLALGTAHASTQDMAAAYGVYANNGVKVSDHAIVKVDDAKGNTVITPKITKNRVMKETTAYIVNNMLRSVVTNGTGYNAQFGNWAVAGKTGTSSLPDNLKNRTGNTDAWFAGYTPKYAAVVWLGFDSNPDINGAPGPYYLHSVYGGSYPALIWKQVMQAAHEDLPVQTKFEQPSGIVSGSYDKKSGLLPSSLTPSNFIGTEIAAQGDLPTRTSDVWVQKEVDADNPTMLASPNSTNTITKTFLNLPNRDPSWTWPSDEAPYKPPTEIAPDPVEQPTLDSSILDPLDNANLPQDSKIPTPLLGQVIYDPKTSTVKIPVTAPSGTDKYTAVVYVQRSGQPLGNFLVNYTKGFLSFSLALNDKAPTPGPYYFSACFKDPSESKIGPSSNTVKLVLTD
ncbi:penicillin-binding protein, 1A family [Desulfosporosinus orientis DSM 765]|uniref:Penicillin-binding protein 1A n=1 Tax=Desulfosporosinus orientis (strain ATCC 19365 / DSM 765 / NCIMB 8382 / VKM B-1628 / Singapore I) TaxID=768706 RepID=G7W7G7_DESOD|nr:PBP1A family penicillin-binding protein [Desulfosporosinus orientis]AET65886.1 penicillin-binding protein, 1A family [Desulfosporosinus orientis DSM 765]